MIKRLTIRQRILVTFIAIVLVGSILQLVIAGRQLQQATLEFYQHHLETDALMIASTLSEPVEQYLDGENTSSIQRLLGDLQQNASRDYLIMDRSYRVIGYTGNTDYEAINHSTATPELTQASAGRLGADIRADSEGDEQLYIAVAIQYEQNPVGYLVVSRPMKPAYVEVYQQWLQLSSTTLPVIALVIITGLWLSGTISRPMQQLRNSALKMAEGAFDTRIESDTQDEVGQLARAFNYMAEKLEGLMKTQRNFVSNAAHELRTPLMTLKLRVEALQDDALPTPERVVYLAELHEEIDHMAELVSSLLVLARIDEEGRHNHDGNANLTDPSSALRDIARHWRIEAEQAGLDFVVDIPVDLPAISLTANDLRLVLDNLLGNAIKYTPQGKVTFSVRQDNGHVNLRVTDTGSGFQPEQAEQLFVRFYRSDETRAHFEGNGLGLSIVDAILKQYGGTIRAESQGVGTGATFTVMLPLKHESNVGLTLKG